MATRGLLSAAYWFILAAAWAGGGPAWACDPGCQKQIEAVDKAFSDHFGFRKEEDERQQGNSAIVGIATQSRYEDVQLHAIAKLATLMQPRRNEADVDSLEAVVGISRIAARSGFARTQVAALEAIRRVIPVRDGGFHSYLAIHRIAMIVAVTGTAEVSKKGLALLDEAANAESHLGRDIVDAVAALALRAKSGAARQGALDLLARYRKSGTAQLAQRAGAMTAIVENPNILNPLDPNYPSRINRPGKIFLDVAHNIDRFAKYGSSAAVLERVNGQRSF